MEIVIRAERLWDILGQRGGGTPTTGQEIQGLKYSTNSNRKAERGLRIESINGAEKFD